MKVDLRTVIFVICCLSSTLAEEEQFQKKNNTEETGFGDQKNNDQNKKDNGPSNDKDKNSDQEKSLKIGNLALPSSQQPGSLVSFGQNIVEKDVLQVFLFGDDYQRRNGHFIDLIPGVVWGVNDQFSIFYNVPTALSYKERSNHSSGLEDIFVQFEYAYYIKEKKYYNEQATIVFNVTLPTGSSDAIPLTGFGVPSCFIGTTYSHTGIYWFYFGAIGSVLTSATKRFTKIGNQILYECGFGRNIPSPKGWIYAWMVEFDGFYTERNRIHGVIDPNSGGNIIFMTPSLWISNAKLVFQLGAGCPIYQHLNGNQIKFTYQVIFNAGYTF